MTYPVRPPPEIEAITERLLSQRGELLGIPPAQVGGRAWLARHSDVIDQAIQDIMQVAAAEVGMDPRTDDVPVTLMATGGYGRRELAPYSDVDLVFVPVEEDNPAADVLIRAVFPRLIEVLMDGARLEVGYAFRPAADLDSLDNTARTALLDARPIAGDLAIAERLQAELLARLDLVGLLRQVTADRDQRNHDPRLSLYALEPDLKHGRGGLRDLQSAVWQLRAHHRTVGGDSLRVVAGSGAAATNASGVLAEAREFIWELRNWLHLSAGQRQDLFSVEYHQQAAHQLGPSVGASSVGDYLEAYYRRAEAVARFADQVADMLLNGELSVGDGLVARGRRLYALGGTRRDSREWLLAAAEHGQRCGFGLSPELAASIAAEAPLMDERVRHSPRAAASFLALLRGGDAERWLRRLYDLGVLERYLPELGAIMRLAPSDPTHVFTVGEHSLRVAGWLAQSIVNPPPAPHLLARAADHVTDTEVLILAGLLHDAGKLAEGEGHSLSGERIARSVGERLGLGRARVDTLGLLVREHLLLSLTSRLRDTQDPATTTDVVQRAGDQQTLSMLYLLSEADLRNVSPGSNILVELHLLDDVYSRALAASDGQSPTAEVMRTDIARRLDGAPRRALQRLLERMPPRYLLNTTLAEIAGDVDLLDRLEREEPAIEIRSRRGLSEITVCVHDDPQPGLLHKITGTLFAHDLDIHAAQAFTTEEEHPVALDKLWASRRRAPLTEAQARRLMEDLGFVLTGEDEINQMLTRKEKTPAAVSLEQIRVRNNISEEHTVIEIEAADTPGLLFRLTGALSSLALDIHTAKITTWRGRAVDAFYVTRRDTDKPADEELSAIEADLRRSVATAHAITVRD
jgi:[protein-PII] uridylyltransferase